MTNKSTTRTSKPDAVEDIPERYYYEVEVREYDGEADADYAAAVEWGSGSVAGLFADTRGEVIDRVTNVLDAQSEQTQLSVGQEYKHFGPVPVRVETVSVTDNTDLGLVPTDFVETQAQLGSFGGVPADD